MENGAELIVRHGKDKACTSQVLYVESLDPAQVLQIGHKVLLGDGILSLETIANNGTEAICKVVMGGRVRSRMGIAFPDSEVLLPATTSKDLVDLRWGIDNSVDFIAISFVRDASDILKLRHEIRKHGGDQRIIAKIERRSAVQNIESILDVSDGIMVARGDLGVELPLETLPVIQRTLIQQANYRGVPVIVATQMLHSMITSLRPTRAEVSDVSGAVMLGADALMLSEETAIGEHPVEAVRYLSSIAMQAEQSFQFEEYKPRLRESDWQTVPDAVAYAACGAAIKIDAGAIISCTDTGGSARLVAKYRPQQQLYGASSNPTALRRMCLYWGVTPVSCAVTGTHHDEVDVALRNVQERENLPNGSFAVVTSGLSVREAGSTCVMQIRALNFRV